MSKPRLFATIDAEIETTAGDLPGQPKKSARMNIETEGNEIVVRIYRRRDGEVIIWQEN